MINRQELEQKAAEFEINIPSVQRDYVLGHFLFALFSQSGLKTLLFLKGGNALRKGYFENTRYSYDLDLGAETDIDPEFLREERSEKGVGSLFIFALDDRTNALSLQALVAWRC